MFIFQKWKTEGHISHPCLYIVRAYKVRAERTFCFRRGGVVSKHSRKKSPESWALASPSLGCSSLVKA